MLYDSLQVLAMVLFPKANDDESQQPFVTKKGKFIILTKKILVTDE